MRIYAEYFGSKGETEKFDIDLSKLLWIKFELDGGSVLSIDVNEKYQQIISVSSESRISVEPRAANVIWVRQI